MWLNVTKWLGPARVVGLCVLVAALALKVVNNGLMETLQLRTFDTLQQFKPRQMTAPLPVAIIDIDEKSLAGIGQWPWPRTLVADLVDRLMAEGVAAIAFDIVFAEPDRLSPGHYADIALDLPLAVREELKSRASNDEILARSLGRARVVVGQVGAEIVAGAAERKQPPQTPVAQIGDASPYVERFPGLLRNIAPIEDAATGRGLFSVRDDFDRVVRRVPMVAAVGNQFHPSLAAELLRVATGQDAFLIKSDEAGVKSIVVGRTEVPTDRNGRIWVNYAPHDPARFVSAIDLIKGQVPKGRLGGHLVLVGTSAIGLGDLRATPLGVMPGVEIHAQLLETILSQTPLIRPYIALGIEVVAAAILSLLMIALMPVVGAARALALGAGSATLVAGGCWLLFSRYRIVLDPLYPLATSFAVFAAVTFMNYRQEEQSRRSIRNAFARYLDPAMVEQLAQRPDRLTLGGETRELTLLFSDVRGFTAISESYRDDPQGLTRLMNRLLTPISRAIIEHRGTIDKYMGDAVMAFWNAPLDDDDHAGHACAASLEIVKRLVDLNAERAAEDGQVGRPHIPISIGIGLNSGHCVVGNMGSDIRFDYSVLGDSVNLASRLEGQTKDYGIQIMLGEETAAKVMDRFAIVEVDLIRVKGKAVPARCFTLVGGPDLLANPLFAEARQQISALLSAYRSQQWTKAQEILAQSAAARSLGLGGLLDVYQQRIATYAASPPAKDWDGVYDARSK